MATLCHICETVGPYNAIGKVAMESVRIAVDAGYKVTVVAKRLHESLRDRVEWRELYSPPRGFALQWLSGRHFIKKALGDRKFDIVHGHQPQIPDLCDVFQCHFLTRVAYERGCMDSRKSIRGRLVRAQEQIVLYAEDYCYRRWPAHTRMLYDSELTRQDFHRLYGECPNEGVLVYPCKPANFATAEQRRAARQALVGDEKRTVIGYLGGLHERKGYKRLIDALIKDDRFFLLMGGQYSESFNCPELAGRYKAMGLVDNIEQFYAACDVFAIPSYYEPFGLVAFEAAGRGTPVLATPEVGALPHLIEHDAGSRWDPATPIGPLVLEMVARREQFAQGAARMLEEFGAQRYGQRLLDEYSRVLNKADSRDPAQARGQSLIGVGA